MEIKNFIGVYNFFTPEHVSAFLRTFGNIKEFEEASIISNDGSSKINKNIRDVKNYGLSKFKGITEAHWFNLICAGLVNTSEKYFNEKEIDYRISAIETINLLKYNKGGFYKKHNDSGYKTHRELSAIIFLNNDYEGGYLQFFEPNQKNLILEIKPQLGKIVLWPSNFLYPHQVTPVIKGTRFTIVSWMI